jgi:hypothetical protein
VIDALLLEADFDYGRRLVREALAAPAARARPLHPVYRLFSGMLWAYDDVRVCAKACLPELERESAHDLLPYVGQLFDHPAFTAWREADESIRGPLPHDDEVQLEFLSQNLGEAARWARPGRYRERYVAQLRGMSEWLMLLGDQWAAKVALAAAFAIEDTSIQELPFLGRLSEGVS